MTTWYRKEFPALKKNSAVTKITQVNPSDFTKTRQIWPEPNSSGARSKMFRRDDNSGCLDWPQGTAPNLVPPPTGEDENSSSSSSPLPSQPSPPTASSTTIAQANPQCSSTNTVGLGDVQAIQSQLAGRGNGDSYNNCCTSVSGSCQQQQAFSGGALVDLCGPQGSTQQCASCANLAICAEFPDHRLSEQLSSCRPSFYSVPEWGDDERSLGWYHLK